ncbi:DUF4249 domain-containing protein [Pontibacter diazotrophicus]|nr:DUF4249 domain-containing protein [Pontibacter diazotrophicus]
MDLNFEMMRKTKYILPILLCLPFLLGSCETVVELELPEHTPQLVINAVINPDSLFTVDVSASRSPFSNGAYPQLSDATVQVYQAGQLLFDLQHQGNGIYRADAKPQVLQHYELRVNAPGFPGARATAHIPAAPILSDVKASEASPSNSPFPIVRLFFTLNDVANQENFYYLRAYTPDTSYYDGRPYNRTESLNFTAPIETEFNMESRYFLSDKLFEGKQIPFRFEYAKIPGRTTYVQVAHISKEYYEYARTLQRQAGGDDFGKLPSQVTNSIRNGFGIFAGYNAVRLAVKP